MQLVHPAAPRCPLSMGKERNPSHTNIYGKYFFSKPLHSNLQSLSCLLQKQATTSIHNSPTSEMYLCFTSHTLIRKTERHQGILIVFHVRTRSFFHKGSIFLPAQRLNPCFLKIHQGHSMNPHLPSALPIINCYPFLLLARISNKPKQDQDVQQP